MNDWLLTDDELVPICGFETTQGIDEYERDIARAQAEKMIDWLYETCPHGIGDFRDDDEVVTQCHRIDCSLCRRELVGDTE